MFFNTLSQADALICDVKLLTNVSSFAPSINNDVRSTHPFNLTMCIVTVMNTKLRKSKILKDKNTNIRVCIS